jgi:hypothetical protein
MNCPALLQRIRVLGLGVVLLLVLAAVAFMPKGGSAEPTIATPQPTVDHQAIFLATFARPATFPLTATPFPTYAPPPTRTPAAPLSGAWIPPTSHLGTPIPGADRGGLFGDGRQGLARPDTSTWSTYTNSKWGYSFRYPPDWQLRQGEAGPDHIDVGGIFPRYPRQRVDLQNPRSEHGTTNLGPDCPFPCTWPSNILFFEITFDLPGFWCGAGPFLVLVDVRHVSERLAHRCVSRAGAESENRAVHLAFPWPDIESKGLALIMKIVLVKGHAVSPTDQAVLEAILDSLLLTH